MTTTLTQVKGIQVVTLPEKARHARVPQEIDPQLKKLVDGLKDKTKEGLLIEGTATEDEIEYFFKQCLAISRPEEMTNHEKFMLAFTTMLGFDELKPIKTGNQITGGITTRGLLSKFKSTRDGKRILNCFIYDQNWKSFESFDKAEIAKFKYRMHFYQDWMGLWQKKHNGRTWLSCLDSVQAVTKTKSDQYKFYLIWAWGSQAFMKVLNKIYQGKTIYRNALISKAQELGLVH